MIQTTPNTELQGIATLLTHHLSSDRIGTEY
jgi:hypothetical protein